MRPLTSIGPVRACILFAGTSALLAATWGLSNSSWAYSVSRSDIGHGNAHASAGLPVIVMPTVTVIRVRDPSTTQSVKVARRSVREGMSSSMAQSTQ